ncbi:MAG TPA: hypothetical protein VNB90_10110 [Cytophagaceae bacterium]|nr:hypothetical protein [Cytophagaceae bacterium]
MYKFIAIIILSLAATATQAQVIVKWDELNRDWYINSGGYPADEPVLDSLYYKLHDFKLQLKADGTYRMVFSKTKEEIGKFETDKKKRELILIENGTGKRLAYSVAELTPDLLMLTIGEKYTWAYYLSLTSHQ